jgi:hypothetical protein
VSYDAPVKRFRWSAEKDDELKAERGISFEAIVVAVGAGGLLDVLPHPDHARYPQQRIMVVAVDAYAYLVPFVEEDEYVFLKTIIPSRKATREYPEEGEGDDRP